MHRVLEFLADQRNLVRPVVPEAEAEQGVGPVIVMPVAPRVDRGRYVTKRDLVKYGYTYECQACTQLASGMHNAKVPHDDRCRDRIGELMAGDDDQRQVERMMSRTTAYVESEIPCPETGEEVDVGEPSVQPQAVPHPVEEQPIPTVRVGGSSGSGTRSGVGSRASETNTDDREVKRVRFTESRGQKRQGEDDEELAAKAEEQHLDAHVEVPAHKTWRDQDVLGFRLRTSWVSEAVGDDRPRPTETPSDREDRSVVLVVPTVPIIPFSRRPYRMATIVPITHRRLHRSRRPRRSTTPKEGRKEHHPLGGEGKSSTTPKRWRRTSAHFSLFIENISLPRKTQKHFT